MLFKITLNKNIISSRRTIIPSVKQLSDTLISLISTDYDRKEQLTRYFQKAVPSFYIPDHNSVGGKTVLASNSYYVYYSMGCPWMDTKHMGEQVKQFDSFLGCSAQWELSSDKVEYNCFVYKHGIEVEGVNGPIYYLLNEELPKAPVTFHAPQRLTIAISPSINRKNGLRLTNAFHKYLVAEMPFNHQAKGFWGNSSIPEDECLNYYWKTEGDQITHLTVECTDGISDEIINHFDVERSATFFQERIPMTFTLSCNEYYQIEKHTHYKTSELAVSISNEAHTKNAAKCIEKEIANNLLKFMNAQEKVETSKVKKEQGNPWTTVYTDSLGAIKIKAEMQQTEPINRGSRRGGESYVAELLFEMPVALSAIGRHRRFGSGRVESV